MRNLEVIGPRGRELREAPKRPHERRLEVHTSGVPRAEDELAAGDVRGEAPRLDEATARSWSDPTPQKIDFELMPSQTGVLLHNCTASLLRINHVLLLHVQLRFHSLRIVMLMDG